MVLVEVIVGSVVFIWLLAVWWQRSCESYWRKAGVPYIPGRPFIGSGFFYKQSIGEFFRNLYNDEKTKDSPITGFYFFHKASLLIRDPELIKKILIKDFNSFMDRAVTSDPHSDIIGNNMLPMAKGEKWRYFRSNLSPLFTGTKMRNFYNILKDVTELFENKLADETQRDGFAMYEIKDLCALLTVEMLARCAFGVNANCLNNPKAEFYKYARLMTDYTWRSSLELFGSFFFPELASIFKFKIFSHAVNNFMRNSITHVMAERERTGVKLNDLIDTLISMKNTHNEVYQGDVLVAQATVFLMAGHETTSSAVSFLLYELAKNTEIQEAVRKEILEEIQKNGEIGYERINELEYLEMVIQETLRMYTTLPYLDRVFMTPEDITYSCEPQHKFHIPKGMSVYIPSYAIHRDPKFYPEPNKFNPERFRDIGDDPLSKYFYLSFGIGPRRCVGARFGMLQVKLAVIAILRNYSVEKLATTPDVLEIDKKSLVMLPGEPLNLIFRRLKK